MNVARITLAAMLLGNLCAISLNLNGGASGSGPSGGSLNFPSGGASGPSGANFPSGGASGSSGANFPSGGASGPSGASGSINFNAPSGDLAGRNDGANAGGAFPRNEQFVAAKKPSRASNHYYVFANPSAAARPDYNGQPRAPAYVRVNPNSNGISFNPNPSGQRLPADSPFDWFAGIFNHQTDFENTPNAQAPAQSFPSFSQGGNAPAGSDASGSAPAGSGASGSGSAGFGPSGSGASGSGPSGSGPSGASFPSGGSNAGYPSGQAISNNGAQDLIPGNPYASVSLDVPNNSVQYGAPNNAGVINQKYYNNFPYNLNSVSGFMSGHLPIRPYSNNWYGSDWAPYPGEWINKALGYPSGNSGAVSYQNSNNAGWQQVNLPSGAAIAAINGSNGFPAGNGLSSPSDNYNPSGSSGSSSPSGNAPAGNAPGLIVNVGDQQ